MRKSWNEAKIYKNVGLLTTFMGNVGESETKTMFIIDIYGISSQHFDTYLKPLLFLTKLNRANLVVFAFSDYYFAEKVRKYQQQHFAPKVRKSWNEAKIYKKVGLLTTFLCNAGESETENMLIRPVWRFFTALWHIFQAITLPDKIQQSKFGSFRVLRL